jgi:hypothetical protein
LRLCLLEARKHTFACIVDKDVDGAEVLMDVAESALDRQRVGDVAGNCAGKGKLLRQRLEPFLLTREQYNRIACLRKFTREGGAITGTRADDDADRRLYSWARSIGHALTLRSSPAPAL